ncbi:trithorax group protein OSA [Tanacetum coccineum]|uniref:Trithorax group protein OSA n=1 Tax=Tanacetum coccineum TaxID=301880 RepID=A0ABQ5EYC3_9ASTR
MGFDNDCMLFKHHVPANYFCPVCETHVYPNEALQTLCGHLFCRPCLAHVASSTQACPRDGHLVTETCSKLLVESNKGLADAVGRTVVLCNYYKSGCMWVGTLSDCIVHRSKCAYGDFEFVCMICGIKILHRDAEDHAKICNVNVYPQVQNPAQNQHHAQLVPQMHHHLPSLEHSNGQSQPPPQTDGHPQIPFYPQFQIPQSQQFLQAPPQQYPSLVQPLSESIPTFQVPLWFTPPPHPLLPLEPPMRLPSQGQAPELSPAPVIHAVQPPMPHQYVQLPQVYAGYTSGPVQGQSPHLCSGGPPQLLQQPPLGYVQAYYLQPYVACFQDGSESSDILRKTKSMSWCRICKVDCGSVEGLGKHCQTCEHQRITMDMVRKIKQKSAQIAKLVLFREASKSGSEGSLGCESKP